MIEVVVVRTHVSGLAALRIATRTKVAYSPLLQLVLCSRRSDPDLSEPAESDIMFRILDNCGVITCRVPVLLNKVYYHIR